MFKVGDKVVINKKAINKYMVGKEFKFGGYLKEPQAFGADYRNVDCILIDDNGKLYYGCTERIDKVTQYDTSYDGTYIKVNGHETIVSVKHGDDTYVGIAKCSPEDKFNLDTGIRLAMNRAYDKLLDKIAFRTEVKPPKGKLPINTRVTIKSAGKTYTPARIYIDNAIKDGSLSKYFIKFLDNDNCKYYTAYGSKAVPNVKFAVRGYTELFGNNVYFIQELDTDKHELFVIREDGIAIDQ